MTYVRLKMKSPLVVSGRKLNNNFSKSLSYIPGDRVRAAFAKCILQNCPVYEINKKEFIDDKENITKYNWVYYRNKEQCKKCNFSKVCKKFSSMKFSFFYPGGTDVLPFTAMKCKYSKEHGFKDILIRQKELKCKNCIEKDSTSNAGRMEAVYGLRKRSKVFELEKVIYTRNAIDKYTKTSKKGALYNIVAVKDNYFEGEIEGIEDLLEGMEKMREEKVIRIGSYTSIGMGIFQIEYHVKNNDEENLIDRLNKFNERIKKEDYLNEYDRKFIYIPILLKSEAKLGLEKESIEGYLSDDKYREIWKTILKKDINFEFDVERVYTETENYRGYDLSRVFDEIREEIVILNKMGTTILLRTTEKLENLVEKLENLQVDGVGFERENGFGKIEICNELHLKGEIYE